MKKLLVLAGIILIACLGLFLGSMGFFASLKITETTTGPYVAASERFVGDYTKVGPVFTRVSAGLKELGLDPKQGIGIYYDDPRKVSKHSLRSDCGFILEGQDFTKIVDISKKYTIVHLLSKPSLVVEFPLRNSLSYMLGAMRSYPILMKHLRQNKYRIIAVYELYDMPARRIRYVLQVDKSGE